MWQACGRREMQARNLVDKHEGQRTLGIPGRRREGNVRIDLKNKCDGTARIGFIWLRTETSGRLFSLDNNDLVSTKCEEFLY